MGLELFPRKMATPGDSAGLTAMKGQTQNERAAGRRWSRGRLGSVAGLGLALALVAGSVLGREREPGAVALWVADREGQSLLGLDGDLYVVETRRASWPVGVLTGQGGRLWTVEAPQATPLGDHRLAQWAAGGELLWEAELGPVLDLAADGAGRVLVVEMGTGSGEGNRLLLADPEAALVAEGGGEDLVELLSGPLINCAAGEAGMVLVGTGDGRLLVLRHSAPSRVLRVLEVGGQVGDVAPVGWPSGSAAHPRAGAPPVAPAGASAQEPGGNGWWILDVATPGRLLRLDADLGVAWELPTGIRPAHLIPDAGRGCVWAADVNEPFVRRWGVDGSLELNLGDLPLGGLDRGVVLGGGIVLTAPGALLRLDGTGGVLPGQGGFHFPVDLAAVE